MTTRRRITRALRVRIFDAAKGLCHICGLPIRAPKEQWDVEHVDPLWSGGKDDESNWRPAHTHCHKDKSAQEAAPRAKGARVRADHLGIRRSKGRPMIGSKASGWKRKMDGTLVRRHGADH